MEITSLEKCWSISDIVQEVSTPSCLLPSPYHLLTLPQAWHHHSQWSSTHEKPHYVVGLNPSRDPWPEMGCGPGNSLDKCQLGHVAGIFLPCWQSSPVPSPGRGALVIVSSSHKPVLELLWLPPFSWVGAMGIAWSPPQWIDSTRALWVVPAGRLGPWRQSSVTTPGWQPENCDGRGSTLCPQARRVDVFQASSSRQQPMRPGRGSVCEEVKSETTKDHDVQGQVGAAPHTELDSPLLTQGWLQRNPPWVPVFLLFSPFLWLPDWGEMAPPSKSCLTAVGGLTLPIFTFPMWHSTAF